MAIEKLPVDVFMKLAGQYPVLDVRSPGEYRHAHIPGAYNLPLFTDDERKVVGTAYKQTGKETAIKIGLDYFGPKMRKMVEEVESVVAGRRLGDSKTVLVHCWRGGMRSAGVAWLLDLYGFKVYTLVGGYKKFRNHVLETFLLPWQFNIVGGYTGSGKTEMLHELRRHQQPVIDLESLANHKGSAFGGIGMPQQPSQEMFENLLAIELRTIVNCEASVVRNQPAVIESTANLEPQTTNCCWIEDESQRIGDINIPQSLWLAMRKGKVFFMDIPFEERLQHIVNWYGKQDKERMVNAIIRIKKRLGGLETKTAINYLVEDNITESFRVLLNYYDKWYLKSLHTRVYQEDALVTISCNTVDEKQNVTALLAQIQLPVLK